MIQRLSHPMFAEHICLRPGSVLDPVLILLCPTAQQEMDDGDNWQLRG